MALFNCKACGGAVSVQAKTCPTCGADLVGPNAAQNNLIGCLILIGIAAAIGFGMKACGDSTPSAPPTAAQIEAGQKRTAFDMCEGFITKHLRDPSSADFISQYDMLQVTKNAAIGSYTMLLRVRAANGFGGKTISDFSCEVKPSTDDNWLLIGLHEDSGG